MRIAIHGGMHKAASTSLQKLCFKYRAELREYGFMYPVVDRKERLFNHNHWIGRAYYENDFSWCKSIVKDALESVGRGGCIILSAENLEYFAGGDFPERLFKSLILAGASSVEWAFVCRNPVDYHASLYSQFGRGRDPDRPVLDFFGSAVVAAKWGCLEISSVHQTHKFIFDYPAFLESFSGRVSGGVVAIPFEDMIGGKNHLPGDPLLRWLSGGHLTMNMLVGDKAQARRLGHVNRRLAPLEVEERYARRFIGTSPDSSGSECLVSEIARARLAYRYRTEPEVAKLLSERFHNWREVFAKYPATSLSRIEKQTASC